MGIEARPEGGSCHQPGSALVVPAFWDTSLGGWPNPEVARSKTTVADSTAVTLNAAQPCSRSPEALSKH